MLIAAAVVFTLMSQTFADGGTMPPSVEYQGYNCAGKNMAPDLHWSGAPSGTGCSDARGIVRHMGGSRSGSSASTLACDGASVPGRRRSMESLYGGVALRRPRRALTCFGQGVQE